MTHRMVVSPAVPFRNVPNVPFTRLAPSSFLTKGRNPSTAKFVAREIPRQEINIVSAIEELVELFTR